MIPSIVILPIIFAILSSAAPFDSLKYIAPRQVQGQNYPPADVKGPTPKDNWVQTYNAAKAAGKIPSIPPSFLNSGGNPTYPTGTDTSATGACSWSVNYCYGPYDIAAPKDGVYGVAFDDGPQLASPPLYSFLKSQNQTATHFMIGSRILDNPSIFQQAVSNGEQIAVHTWSHPRMTTLTDLQVVGELGWTLQIIYDQSNLIPTFWRPPYGDVDNRVRAIAYYVFGMYTTLWNHDTFDWCFSDSGSYGCGSQGPGSDGGLDSEYRSYASSPKSPGISPLSHELSSHSVNGFIRNYPVLKAQGWTIKAIGDIWNSNWYHNSVNTLSLRTGNVSIGSGTYSQSLSVVNSSIPIVTSITTTSISTPTPSAVTALNISRIPTLTNFSTSSSPTSSSKSSASQLKVELLSSWMVVMLVGILCLV